MECTKIKYESEESAKKHLQEIVESNWRNRKSPSRYYVCEKCGSIHLTSKISTTKYYDR